jgi:hypothetical protein
VTRPWTLLEATVTRSAAALSATRVRFEGRFIASSMRGVLANVGFCCRHSNTMRPRSGRYHTVAVSSKRRYAGVKRPALPPVHALHPQAPSAPTSAVPPKVLDHRRRALHAYRALKPPYPRHNVSFCCSRSNKMRPRSGRYHSSAVCSKHRYTAAGSCESWSAT